AGKAAASGRALYDLRSGDVFRGYVESILDAASVSAPEVRELLALITAVRTVDLDSAPDVAAIRGITGIGDCDLRRRFDALADAGLVAELPDGVFAVKPDLLSDEILRYSFFDEKRRPPLQYRSVYQAFAPYRRIGLLQALSEARVGSSPAAKEALRIVRADLLCADAQLEDDGVVGGEDVGALKSPAGGVPAG